MDVKLAAVSRRCHGVIVQTQFVWGITLTDFLVEVWQGYLMLAKTTREKKNEEYGVTKVIIEGIFAVSNRTHSEEVLG